MSQAGEASQGGLRPAVRRWIDLIPYAVLLVGVLLSVAAAVYVAWAARAKDAAKFREQVEHAETQIGRRLDLYVAALRSTAGFFAPDPQRITRQAFKDYAQRLDLRDFYPGVQGIGFTLRVPPDQTVAVGERLKREWGAAVKLWPEHANPERHAIVYLEPEDRRNLAAIGFDMFSDPIRRAAMERARDTGQPVASGKVELVQEIDADKQSGFLIYVPVYAGGASPETPEARRAGLVGFVYSPFRAANLLGDIFGDEAQRQLDFEVFDGPEAKPEARLYATPGTPERSPDFEDELRTKVAGRPWTVVLRARPTFEAGSARAAAWWVLAGGLVMTALLFLLTRAEARARRRAEQAAAELDQSRLSLLQSLDARSRAEAARKELLERERQAREEAEAANRVKDDFLATVSHELRTPLNAMLGWAQLLQQGDMIEASRDEAVEAIERNAKAQAQLIEDLLDLSRIMRGKLQLSQSVMVDLGGVVESAIDAVGPSARARHIGIETRLEPGIGPVKGDPTRLQQVVWNLLSNSIKFSPDRAKVVVSLERRGGDAVIRVTDAGKGIAPEFLPHVFDRFRQADASTTRQQGGLGLGLAIVRNIVEMHGGAVEAFSEGEGRGATFTVTLPLAPVPPAVEKSPVDGGAGDGRAPRVSLDGVNVLVVDDDPDARRLVGKVLERYGARVCTAGTAAEAMAAIDRQSPDVLLSDIAMPGEDGYMLIAKIRSRDGGHDIPAAALTAFAREEDRLRAIEAGFQAHVAKPVQSARLVGVVADLARGRVTP